MYITTSFPSNIDTNSRNYGNYVQNYHNSREAYAHEPRGQGHVLVTW